MQQGFVISEADISDTPSSGVVFDTNLIFCSLCASYDLLIFASLPFEDVAAISLVYLGQLVDKST